jgi:hypothetical protein
MSDDLVQLSVPERDKLSRWAYGWFAVIVVSFGLRPRALATVVGLAAAGFALAALKDVLTKRSIRRDGLAMIYDRAVVGVQLEHREVAFPEGVTTTYLRTTPRARVRVYEISVVGRGGHSMSWVSYGHDCAMAEAAQARRLLTS